MHKKHLHYAVISVVGFAILMMSIGFAAYSQIMNNSTNTHAAAMRHEVGFVAKSYLESDASISPTAKTINRDSLSFSLHMNPGENYSAVINVANTGSYDEVLESIILSQIPSEYIGLVNYRVSFADEDYIATSEELDIAMPRSELNRQQLFVNVSYSPYAQKTADLDLFTNLVFAD